MIPVLTITFVFVNSLTRASCCVIEVLTSLWNWQSFDNFRSEEIIRNGRGFSLARRMNEVGLVLVALKLLSMNGSTT